MARRSARPPTASNVASRSVNAPSSSSNRTLLVAVFAAFVAIGAVAFHQYGAGIVTPGNVLEKTRHERNLGNAPFEVVDLPGRGKGLIATRHIQQGELLIREEPLIRVPDTVQSSPEELIANAVRALPPAGQEAFFGLSYAPIHLDPGAPPDVLERELPLAIFQTNVVATGNGVGLFPRMARLNHGCSSAFNAVYSWREDEGVLLVHALKAIKKGEELLTTYTDTKRPRDVRRSYLQQQYGFGCECAVCSLPPALSSASDRRLQTMSDLYARFASWGSNAIDGREAVSIARQIWAVGEQEGYWSERGRLAADAAWVAAAHRDAVVAWARLAAEWYGYELGRDSAQVREMERLLREPSAHQAWGSKRAMAVGEP